MVSRESELYKDALKKAMPNLDLGSITEFYQRNLEYMSSVNKVMVDINKTLYHAHADFVKEISNLSKAAYEKAARDANNPKKIAEDAQEAMNICSAVCSKYSDQVDNIMKSSGEKVSDITKGHLQYAADKAKVNPFAQILSKTLNPSVA